MLGLKNKTFIDYLTFDFNNRVAARLFFLALVVFMILKIGMIWSLSHVVMDHHKLSLPRSWMGKMLLAPAFLADYNIDLFFIAVLVFLVFAFLVKSHVVVNAIFFWLTFNLYIVVLPFANGSDLVLFMLALWCIPLATHPVFRSPALNLFQKAAFNTGVLLCQLQVIFIYLVSGYDKVLSEVWRSGVAIDYITHLTSLYNPLFEGWFEVRLVQQILSWLTILFELAFVVLIWVQRTRLMMLAIGVIFHLFIWFVLSLPDFALIMMISYIIFLKDSDLLRLRVWLKQ